MNDLQDIYAEVVMDHNRRPRNSKRIDNPDRSAEGFNPLCGDQISLYLTINAEDIIEDIGCVSAGCAISKAASSMMTEAVKGRSFEYAQKVIENFRLLLTKDVGDDFDYEILGDLEILEGVSSFPTRIKCATLPVHTLASALEATSNGAVSTE